MDLNVEQITTIEGILSHYDNDFKPLKFTINGVITLVLGEKSFVVIYELYNNNIQIRLNFNNYGYTYKDDVNVYYNICKYLRESDIEEVENFKPEISKSFSESFHSSCTGNANISMLSELIFIYGLTMKNKNDDYFSTRGTMISYMPYGKEQIKNEESGRWLREGRQTIRPGRWLNKLSPLCKFLSKSDVEHFSNKFIAGLSIPGAKFQIVEGEALREAYYCENYSETINIGCLDSSCMKHEECQGYMDLYVNNKDVCKMLVLYDKDIKVIGRALLWEKTKSGNKYMDRIYSSDVNTIKFKDWASQNGYYYKMKQSYDDDFCHKWIDPNTDKVVTLVDTIELDNDHEYYPYMDTFKFSNGQDMITNDVNIKNFVYTSTEGYRNEFCYCKYQDTWGEKAYCKWSKLLDSYLNMETFDIVHCEVEDDWVPLEEAIVYEGTYRYRKDVIIDYNNILRLKKDCVICKHLDAYCLADSATILVDGNYHPSDKSFLDSMNNWICEEIVLKATDGKLIYKEHLLLYETSLESGEPIQKQNKTEQKKQEYNEINNQEEQVNHISFGEHSIIFENLDL